MRVSSHCDLIPLSSVAEELYGGGGEVGATCPGHSDPSLGSVSSVVPTLQKSGVLVVPNTSQSVTVERQRNISGSPKLNVRVAAPRFVQDKSENNNLAVSERRSVANRILISRAFSDSTRFLKTPGRSGLRDGYLRQNESWRSEISFCPKNLGLRTNRADYDPFETALLGRACHLDRRGFFSR
jgi:hypothetical protein